MNKVHQSPEFQLILQNQANAKFFVASFVNNGSTDVNPPVPSLGANEQYGNDGTTFDF